MAQDISLYHHEKYDGTGYPNKLKGDEIHIYQSEDRLQLIHPKNYSYYNVLRGKLGWSSRLF